MKRILALATTLIFSIIVSFANNSYEPSGGGPGGKGGGGGQQSGGSTAGGSGTGGGGGGGGGALSATQIQTGYHYKIKYTHNQRHFFQYVHKYTKTELNTTTGEVLKKKYPNRDISKNKDSTITRDTIEYVYHKKTLSVAITQEQDSSQLKIYFKGLPEEELTDIDKKNIENDKKILLSENKLLALGVTKDMLNSLDNDSTLSLQSFKITQDTNSADKEIEHRKSLLPARNEYRKRSTTSLQSRNNSQGLLSNLFSSLSSCFPSLFHPANDHDYKQARELDIYHDTLDDMYLLVKKSRFFKDSSYFIRIPFSMGQFGTLTIPFQYQFGYRYGKDTVPNNFVASLNIALYYGRVWGRTRFYYDPTRTTSNSFMLAVFAGPTLISLSSTNTLNKSSATSNQIGLSTGLSLSTNLRYFNLGLFGGINIPSSAARNYDYAFSKNNPIPWIGFGIGFNIPMFTQATNEIY
jgi:hypothetical protein